MAGLRLAYPRRLSRAAAELGHRLAAAGRPVITPYELFPEVRSLYVAGSAYHLKKTTPDRADYQRLLRALTEHNVLIADPDYGHRAYRIVKNSDLSADDICCLVDPFCYISHLSAMQRYGLTNRRPRTLQLTRPSRLIMRQLAQRKMQHDYGAGPPRSSVAYIPLHAVTHPQRVRAREIDVFETAHPGEFIQVRGSYARISTIGQTFLDTIEAPPLCGGMTHVLEVWKESASRFFDEIIEAVDRSHVGLAKVRAGYLLEEVLGKKDKRIETWLRFAQRGGSRLLDPTKQYVADFSERWMISINV